MTDYRKASFDLFDQLSREHHLFARMRSTVEGSPWHREANVLVHTEMVLNEYARRVDAALSLSHAGPWRAPWARDHFIGAVECIFHDVGKPSSEITKHSVERGEYRAYHNHELASARLFEDWATQQGSMFTPLEIARIVFMIEYHMPWNIESDSKLKNLAVTAKAYGADIYMMTLLADQFGRTSDDWDANTTRSAAWVEKFKAIVDVASEVMVSDVGIALADPSRLSDVDKVLIMPIGASGSGKSTLQLELNQDTCAVFSLDALRLKWYDPINYSVAFQKSTEDNTFERRADAEFIATVSGTATEVYVDNTNTGAKRRRKYLVEATKRGYMTSAVLMPSPIQLLVDRQKTRGDKSVPREAVVRQYMSTGCPLLGEFDSIYVSGHNIA